MTKRFPSDKAPSVYDGNAQDIFTRAFEDIYSSLDSVDSNLGNKIDTLRQSLNEANNEISGVQNKLSQEFVSQQGPMPVPQNLKILKVPRVPLVVLWCDPIEIIKYPYVGGIQFFASPEPDFTPLVTSALVTYAGNCTSDSGGAVMADTSDVTVSGLPFVFQRYQGIPFWSDMDLVANAVSVVNTTDNSTGTITVWNSGTPWQFTCALSGGSDNTWTDGDGYSFSIQRNRNMIGQGPLPFAVGWTPIAGFNNNTRWDTFAYYGKARFYGRGLPKHRRYGTFTCASTTATEDAALSEPTSITAEPFTESNYIQVTWTAGHDPLDGGGAFSGYKVYRTLANTDPTDETDLIADNLQTTEYIDHGYDVVKYPAGPQPGVTYYYWVRVIDTGGNQSVFDGSDDAILAVPAAPTFISGEEDGTGYGNLKNWLVKWKCTGSALGYFVKYKVTGDAYSLETYVPHTDAFGQDGGEDVQQFTFMGLESGRNYTFAVKAVNNQTVTGLQSAYVEFTDDIENSGPPLPPT